MIKIWQELNWWVKNELGIPKDPTYTKYVVRIKDLTPVYIVMDSPMDASKSYISKNFRFRCGQRLRRKERLSDPRFLEGP